MRLAPGQRHVILQEMGIQTYVPRIVVPGARPSPIQHSGRPETLAPQSMMAAAERLHPSGVAPSDMTPATLRPASPLPEPLPEKVPPASKPVMAVAPTPTAVRSDAMTAESAVPPATPLASTTPSPAEAVHFAFAYVPVNEHLAVICELPWARSAVLTSSCRQLLADMLQAIGAPCEADRLAPMVFSWPLADAGEMPQDAQTARHMLEGFVSRRLKLRAVPNLLILAEQCAALLFPAASQPPAGALQTHPHFPVRVLVTHSLHAMEAVRDLKRSAWQALQPLKQALAEAATRDQRPQV
jgi:hypothetical protein